MIVMREVSKSFNGNQILNKVNLEVSKGEVVAIIGPSGSGKTTLIRTLNGFVVPDEGTVLIDKEPVVYKDKKKIRKLRKRIGMIYQLFNLVERTTVLENVLSGALGHYDGPWNTLLSTIGIFKKEDKERAMELLRFVGLEEKAQERVDKLSGGQKQRVAIARALMQNPDILLADEPVANLDPKTSQKIIELLLKINEEKDITLLCVLHHVDIVKDNFNRVVALNQGQIIYDGPVSSLDKRDLFYIYDMMEKETEERAWKAA